MNTKNYITIYIILLSIFILSLNVYAQSGCTDSDGGIDVETRGLMKTSYTYTDECSGNFLKEYHCMVSPYYLIYECYDGCENGACKSDDVSKQWITCSKLCPSGFKKDSEGYILCECEQGDSQRYERDLMPIGKDYDKFEDYLQTLSIPERAELTHLGLIRPELALRYNAGGKLDEKYKAYADGSVIDLKNHPYILFLNGLPNFIIVIGDNAPKEDIDAANKVLTWFNDRASNQMWPKTKIYKSSEIESTARNIIAIGEPCSNSIAQRITRKTECGFGLEKGEYAIYLWDDDDFANYVVGGSSSDLTLAAVQKLIEFDQFNKFELSGREMIFGQCDGCVNDDYECITIGTRTDNSYCAKNEEFGYFKQNEQACDYNYECESNNCRKNLCKPACQGCLGENDECYPIGTRASNQYCDASGNFNDFKQPSVECNFEYECTSNQCKENKCFEPNMFKRFFNWIKSIF